MKKLSFLLPVLLLSCVQLSDKKTKPALHITGTWKLVSGSLTEKGVTTVTDYTKGLSFIKIINNTHFSFLLHDLSHGSDSSKTFSAGGGRYSLTDSTYTEHLEYCSDRSWEGHDFSFSLTFHNDTLVQRGVERIDSAGINRINVEKYVRLQ